jgi:hypothetical protein
MEAYQITSEEAINNSVRGKVLVGPHEDGAQAIFQPGVWSLTPADNRNEKATCGKWRHGIWRPVNETGLIWATGLEMPMTLASMSLAETVQLIKNEVPEHLDFVEDYLTRKGRLLIGKADNDGLVDLKLETAPIFGNEWVKSNLV